MKITTLSVRDHTVIEVVRATHHQGSVKYGVSRGIQCSRMCLTSVSWMCLFRSPVHWNKFDLDDILGKRSQLFKSLSKFRYPGIEDLPQEFSI